MRPAKTIHFRYARVTCDAVTHEFAHAGKTYRISFQSTEFAAGEGLLVERLDEDPYEPISTRLLSWITLYLGEDALDPRQIRDPVHTKTRGRLVFIPADFDRFLRRGVRYPLRSHPKWRQRLFQRAITYYVHATRLGVYSMPITLGLLGLSLECLGNYDHGRRDKYFRLGDKRFLPLFRNALVAAKRDERTREKTRRFEKFVIQDVELLHQLRNTFYGHSLLHLANDRREVTLAMRRWYVRAGLEKRFAKRSFRFSRVERAMTSDFWPLYKLGLRTARLFLFIAMGSKRVPFASHDFSILDDLRSLGSSNANSGNAPRTV